MVIDKGRASYGESRIAEKTIFTISFLGGFWGVLVASELFRHKTSKLEFLIVIYFSLIVWFVVLLRIGFLQCLISSFPR